MSHFSHTEKKKTSGKGAKKLKNSGLKGHSFTKKKKKCNLNMYIYQEPETSGYFQRRSSRFKSRIPQHSNYPKNKNKNDNHTPNVKLQNKI